MFSFLRKGVVTILKIKIKIKIHAIMKPMFLLENHTTYIHHLG